MDRCSRLRVAGDFGGQLTQTGYGHNSRHNDRIVVKPGQNVRLVSAKLPVKYQRDSYDIKKVSPPWTDGLGETFLYRSYRADILQVIGADETHILTRV